MAELSEVEKSLFKTIVYYNCLDYPLTLDELEIFSFRGNSASREISSNLDSLIEKKLIDKSGGFYFLRNRINLIRAREEKNKIAEKKWRKTLKAVWWLQAVPYLKMVFASGSLALNNTTKESDLDVLIVVKSGRIWTSRFLIVILLSLLGVRRKRHQALAPDKICLNHFITDELLYIPRKSIYTAQLYARLVPIFGDNKLLDEFIETNSWISDYISGWSNCIHYSLRITNSVLNDNVQSAMRNKSIIKFILERILDTKIGDWLDKVLRKYQLRRIKSYHLTYKSGGRVKADDESLEFHPDSPELKIIEKYNQTMKELGFPELGKELDSGLLHVDLTEV